MTQMRQRTVVVTGASSGIGKASAEAFARMGWHVIGCGRDPTRCDQAENDIRSVSSQDSVVDFLRGDFSEMAQVERVADEIAGLTDTVDVLINNAGGLRDQLYRTPEGLEATFAANHVSAFLLTQKLMPLLTQAASQAPAGQVRILAVSSTGHASCPAMKWDDLNHFENFNAGAAYLHAKLANILFTRELQHRIANTGIAAHAIVPGTVSSNFSSHADPATQEYMAGLEAASPEQTARTLVWMATSPETGLPGCRFFHELEEVMLAPQGKDDEAASRLWSETKAILDQIARGRDCDTHA